MDVQTPLICAGVVAVSAAVVYLTSVLGIRERTYEEAIEEQRRRNNVDLGVRSGKTDKSKKEKKDKVVKKAIKKEKAKEKSDDKEQQSQQRSEANNDKPSQSKPSNDEAVVNRKSERVDFKPEPEVVVLENKDVVLEAPKQRRTTPNKPPKSILLKSESFEVTDEQRNELPKQRNSFDLIQPKDEIELLRETKNINNKEVVNNTKKEVNKEEIRSVAHTNSKELSNTASNAEVSELQIKSKPIKSENNENAAKKVKKAKHSQHSSVDSNVREVSAKTIIDIVKSATLNNEEIQILTDALLNKQSDGSTEWRKKNDPMAVLKKQLQEKEAALEAEMKNLQAAVQKNRELRQELANEKLKQTNSREKTQQMQQEIQAAGLRLQQSHENFKSEMKALERQMQAKVNDDRTHIMQLQEENSRLQQLMKNEQHLKHEVEQLRNERQQYDMRITASQKTNEDLLRKAQQYDNHIKSLTESRHKDELAYQKHINDMKQEVQISEAQRKVLMDELNNAKAKCSAIDSEIMQYKTRLDETERSKNEEMNRLIEQLSQLNNDKDALQNELSQALRQHNGDVKQEESEKLVKLNDELSATKEELNNLKNEFETQTQRYNELSEKNKTSLETIANFEKIKNESIQTALNDVKETYNQQYCNEIESLKSDNNSLNNQLKETIDSNENIRQEVNSVKELLLKLIPSLNTASDNWVLGIESAFNELISQKHQQFADSEQNQQQMQDLRDSLTNEQQKNSELEDRISHYTQTLAQTETILSELQNKIENEGIIFRNEEEKYKQELNKYLDENSRLKEENKNLNSSLAQLESLRETISEMESKLIELQSKLQGKTDEKMLLEAKYEEANRDFANLRDELNEKNKEIESFLKEKSEIDRIKAEMEEMTASLEKERKTCRELTTQNVRLNSLVKIGHDSLNAEQEKVKQLEAQLNLNNGSLSSPLNNPAANGSPESLPLNSSSDSTEEFSTFTNQTSLLSTNNKPLKAKRRGASVKK